MQNGRISAWVAVAGFLVLAAGLGLEGVSLYATSFAAARASDTSNDRQPIDRVGPMTRFLFDRTS